MSDWEEEGDSPFGLQAGGLKQTDSSRNIGSNAGNQDAGFGSNTFSGFETKSSAGDFGFGSLDIKDQDSGNNWGTSSKGSDGRGRGRGRGGRGRGGGSMSCFKCRKEGHIARDCPNAEDSGDAGGSFFGASSDGSGGFGKNNQRDSKRGCFKCNQDGHFARDCPNADDNGSGGKSPFGSSFGGGGFSGDSQRSSKRGCFKCGEDGHLSRDCPQSGGGRDESKGGSRDDDLKPRAPLYIPKDLEDDELLDHGIEAGINFDNYENIPVKVSGNGAIPDPVSSFEEMNVRKLLIENIQKAGYRNPTPIQKYSVPVLMDGRDIMGCAQTGSGKTVAFLLPILNHILKENCNSHSYEETALPVGLILAPTRELALQIYYEARKLVRGSTVLCRVSYGGTAVIHQLKVLQSGCHLLVGTVGRVVDFMDRGKLHFSELKFLVLDEADRMLDMGFLSDLKKIFGHSSMPPNTQRQTLMFSATFPVEIQNLASSFMNDYVFVIVGTIGGANTDVSQEILEVDKIKKKDLLIEYIKDLQNIEENMKILVFVEQKKMADFIGAYLCNNGIKTTTIHGDRYQSQREEALETFRNGIFNVLVATAVAARGLDIRGVGCVINFDMPKEVDEYVHRIGRTGRVGNTGHAISFFDTVSDAHLTKDLVKILSDANQEVPEWLMTAAGRSGHAQGYFGSGKYASADVRNLKNQDGERNWSGNALGGPDPPAQTGGMPEDDEDWDT